ncbi:hypothetical protein WN48_05010 [Eufriesea mexicana]|nr:hypothetical protein WN48_05010 [Eufriesea mexicana]
MAGNPRGRGTCSLPAARTTTTTTSTIAISSPPPLPPPPPPPPPPLASFGEKESSRAPVVPANVSVICSDRELDRRVRSDTEEAAARTKEERERDERRRRSRGDRECRRTTTATATTAGPRRPEDARFRVSCGSGHVGHVVADLAALPHAVNHRQPP